MARHRWAIAFLTIPAEFVKNAPGHRADLNGTARKILERQGLGIAYPTLNRFAVFELQIGQTAHHDPGARLARPDKSSKSTPSGSAGSRCRRHESRVGFAPGFHRGAPQSFVYPTFEETTARRLEAVKRRRSFSPVSSRSSSPITPRPSSPRPTRSRPASRPRFSSMLTPLTSMPHSCAMRATSLSSKSVKRIVALPSGSVRCHRRSSKAEQRDAPEPRCRFMSCGGVPG